MLFPGNDRLSWWIFLIGILSFTYLHARTHTYVCIYIYMCVCVYNTYFCVCVCVCIQYVYVWIDMTLYMSKIYVCMETQNTNVYTQIPIYIVYVYIYIYINMWRKKNESKSFGKRGSHGHHARNARFWCPTFFPIRHFRDLNWRDLPYTIFMAILWLYMVKYLQFRYLKRPWIPLFFSWASSLHLSDLLPQLAGCSLA